MFNLPAVLSFSVLASAISVRAQNSIIEDEEYPGGGVLGAVNSESAISAQNAPDVADVAVLLARIIEDLAVVEEVTAIIGEASVGGALGGAGEIAGGLIGGNGTGAIGGALGGDGASGSGSLGGAGNIADGLLGGSGAGKVGGVLGGSGGSGSGGVGGAGQLLGGLAGGSGGGSAGGSIGGIKLPAI